MKASTLVIMLCIGLMCFTGFGNTTADLTKDSETKTLVGDHEEVFINVVILDLDQVSISEGVSKLPDVSVNSEFQAADLFADSLSTFGTTYVSATDERPHLARTEPDINFTGTIKKTSNYPDQFYTTHYFRHPRDGIRCNYFS